MIIRAPWHPRSLPALLLVASVLLLVAPACHPPGSIGEQSLGEAPAVEGSKSQGATLSPYITDGQLDPGHPSVGEVGWDSGPACTGTLVGRRTVVTAAHCIKNRPMIFRLPGRTYHAAQARKHPGYDSNSLANDIAVLVLTQDVQGVKPTPVATVAPTMGQKLILVGFGRTSGSSSDYGQKRIGTNKVSKLTSTTFYYHGTGGGISGTCHGDSGGPAFTMHAGQEILAGVTSWGDQYCQQFGVDTRVDSYRQWIVQIGGKDVVLQGKATPPGGGAPGGGGAATAREGQPCNKRACFKGLYCASVFSGAKLLGRYCMEQCAKLGQDKNCDGGEVCTQHQDKARVCFNPGNPNGGYVNGSHSTTPPPGGAPPPPGSGSSCGGPEEDRAIKLLNKARLSQGIGALSCAPAGRVAARDHSQDMCKRNYFSHTSPDGHGVSWRLNRAKAKFSSAGENIARGYWKAEGVHQGWITSPGHRSNMLNPQWNRVGIARVTCGGANPTWTQVFLR